MGRAHRDGRAQPRVDGEVAAHSELVGWDERCAGLDTDDCRGRELIGEIAAKERLPALFDHAEILTALES